MGKVILEFDSIEEQTEIQDALNGTNWKLAMWDLDQELRKTVKYGVPILKNETGEGTATDVEMDVADILREKIREILDDYNLKLDI
jgi:hypothetical protein